MLPEYVCSIDLYAGPNSGQGVQAVHVPKPCTLLHPRRTTILEIEASGADLSAKWFPVTIDADEAYDNGMIRDLPGPSMPEVCTATLTVTGGNFLDAGNVPLPLGSGPWNCPPGSYFHAEQICPFW